jgi:LytS/YehU family sensor histidine kinase
MYLNKKNDAEVEKELIMRANLDAELQSYKYQINPELLFQTLEIIISELHNDKKAANTLVIELSRMYRYTLDNQNNDLVSLKDEINSLETIYHIFKARYPESLYLNISVDEQLLEDNLIPGTLRILFEKALSENIISNKLKLEISIKSNNKEIFFEYMTHPKIAYHSSGENKITVLQKAYRYFSPVGIRETENEGRMNVILPLLSVEEDIG